MYESIHSVDNVGFHILVPQFVPYSDLLEIASELSSHCVPLLLLGWRGIAVVSSLSWLDLKVILFTGGRNSP